MVTADMLVEVMVVAAIWKWWCDVMVPVMVEGMLAMMVPTLLHYIGQ